ncbi:MAG: NrfD/PsrC family molybdoenzyme membrane anchor subunit [Candidatus Zixiibacteriota bacterium]
MINNRARIAKDILWIFALSGLIAAIFRLVFGLGPTTNLTDGVPWGLWKVFNMIAGVALSTSGFTIGFLVYVLHLKQFKSFMKPAILIAFLGYGCSCLALLFDIGLPFRFWHPIIMWNINSFLFEVFACVLLYFTITSIELAPIILNGINAKKAAKLFHSIAFIAVIIGISLSSLHHSSLGSLFLVSPQRLHPLWYTPRLPLFFIISAMAGGIFFIIFVKIIWSKIYNPDPVYGSVMEPNTTQFKSLNASVCTISPCRLPGPEMINISQLAIIGTGLLSLYFILKIIDLFVLGKFAELIVGSPESWLYILELGIGVLLPIILIALPKTRKMPVSVGIASLAASLGLVFNRLNVGIFGYSSDAGTIYFPSLAEWALGIGVITAAGLVFMVLTENLPIFDDFPAKSFITNLLRRNFNSLSQTWNTVLSNSLNRVSLLGVFVLPLAFIFMYPPYKNVELKNIMPSIGIDAQRNVLKIDGDRSGLLTLFNHADHQKRLGDSSSCIQCHHISLPSDHSTPCSQCHQHMFSTTNIFNHEKHKLMVANNKQLTGLNPSNQSCTECHTLNCPKTGQSTKDCLECHREDMFLTDKSTIKLNTMRAVSFSDAMHLTCLECHRKEAANLNKNDLDKCYTCHLSLQKDQNINESEPVVNLNKKRL